MIESAVNAFQLLVTGICAVIAGTRAARAASAGSRTWTLLLLFSGIFFLGDLYWQLFMMFYGDTPYFSFIPDLSWQSSYLFLYLLLLHMRGERKERKRDPWMWLVPAFTGAMCVFYMRYGKYVSNVICAALMTLIILEALAVLRSIKGNPAEERRCRTLCLNALLFCAAEYGLWTASCFWDGDTFANPYFWVDVLLSVSILLFVPAVRKAVDG